MFGATPQERWAQPSLLFEPLGKAKPYRTSDGKAANENRS
jgi:hypothetical protein